METWQCPRCGALNDKSESVIRLARLGQARGDVKVGTGTIPPPRCANCNFEADLNAILMGKYESGSQATIQPIQPEKSTRPFPLAAGLLNLTGLGLGYLYLRRWIQWILHFLPTILLVAMAYLVDASRLAWLWLPAFGIWVLWMGFDGWRQATRIGQKTGTPPNRRWPYHLASALGILALVFGGLCGYYTLGQQEYEAGMKSYSSGNCSQAVSHMQRFDAVYKLTFNPNLAATNTIIDECNLLANAERARQNGLFEEAIEGYEKYLENYPDGDLTAMVNEKIAGTYSEWATSLCAQTDYEAALEKYKTILRDFGTTQPGGQAQDAIAQTYWDWAQGLRTNNEFKTAEEKYLSLLEMDSLLYPAPDIYAALADTYWEWAAYMRQVGQYETAIQKYEDMLMQENQTYTIAQIRSEIVAAHFEWAIALAHQGSYDLAFSKCETIQAEYASATSDTQIEDLKSQIYIEWGNALVMENRFTDAMQKFDQAKQIATDEDTVQSAQAGYESAQLGLAEDTGEEGRAILEQAGKDACRGKGTASPVIGMLNEPGRFFHAGGQLTIPDTLIATKPGHLKYVVCIEEQEKVLDRCNYTHGYSLTMIQTSWQIYVNDPLTGKSLFRKFFQGPSPGSCPRNWSFSTTEESIIGKPPTAETILEWLRGLLD